MADNNKFTKKYEWVGDVDSYKEPEQNEHSVKYNEPNRDYDSEYKPTKKDIETFPDLQNGPSSLIQGSPVEIQQVGIHNFRLPLKYKTRDNGNIELETKVTGTVSLELGSFLQSQPKASKNSPNLSAAFSIISYF